MMGPKPTPPKGLNDALALINFIQNKDEFAKHIQKLVEYNQKADDYLKTIGKASEIEALHASAKEKEAKAQAFLDTAQEQAIQEISKAEAKVISLVAEAKESARDTLLHANKTEQNAVQREAEAGKLVTQNKVAAEALQKREQAVKIKEQELANVDEEIARKRAILAQLG